MSAQLTQANRCTHMLLDVMYCAVGCGGLHIELRMRCNRTRSIKAIDLRARQKPVYDFLLVIYGNLSSNSHRFITKHRMLQQTNRGYYNSRTLHC